MNELPIYFLTLIVPISVECEFQHVTYSNIYLMGLCAPWDNSYFHNWINQQKLDIITQMTFCWKALYHSQNNCKGFNQSSFVSLWTTLIYTAVNLKNLVWLTWRQSIYLCWQVKSQNRRPRHDLPETCKGSKSISLVWIHPTDKFPTNPKTGFSINERWCGKFNTHDSKITKTRLEQRTWRKL